MKNKILLYILSVLGFITFSCNDDIVVDKSGSESGESDGLTISLKVDVPQMRTRAIDMTPGGALYLNNIWIGVYNKNNGQRILADQVDLHTRLTESGVTLTDVIKIKLNGINNLSTNYDYCVVGVANYDGIKTDDEEVLLSTALNDARDWDAFTKISLDAQQDIPNQTPVLMGYLTNDSDETKHTVIDQLSDGSDAIKVANQTNVYVKGNNSRTGFVTNGYVMNLRRLRSKININLTPRDPQMTITNIEYRLVNVPRSSFLAERSTVTNPTSYNRSYSPNSADYPDSDVAKVNGEGYITLEDLENDKENNEGWQKPTDNYNFTFEHVENKHWAKKELNITDYHERGKQSNGVFYCLADNEDDWNNYASYIVLRISLRDFRDGRNSVIDYTIMEGFCNNADGESQVDADGESQVNDEGKTSDAEENRLKDFSCFRNMDYYYTIHINSVDEIYTTVTSNGTHPHPDDQHNGNIWQMLYPKFEGMAETNTRIQTAVDATYTLKEEEQINCTRDNEGNTLAFDDIGFRLAGSFYDEKRQQKIPVDLCYNVKHGELEGFNGLWIDPINGVTEYFVDTRPKNEAGEVVQGGGGITAFEAMENYFSSSHPDEEAMLARFTVKTDRDNNYLDIREFIKKLHKEEVSQITGVKVKGIKLYETEEESDGPRNHMIGLYIFDKQRSIEGGDRVKTDKENDCHYYQIRAIEQYPAYLSATYEIIYAKYNNSNRIPSTSNTNEVMTTQQIDNVKGSNKMVFSDNPDIAFRLIGYYDKDGSGEYSGFYDICYNFDKNEYIGFNKNEMPPISYDTRTISKTALSRENIPEELLNGIKIKEGENGQAITIKQFISRALAGNISKSMDLRFVFNNYGKKYYYKNQDEIKKSIRGIYIFDKKNRYKQPGIYDADNHAATYQLYAAEQEGSYEPPVKLPYPQGTIYYNQTANKNIVEEYLGTIKVPLLSDYTYNEDYYYNLITKDPSGNSGIRKCRLEKIISQDNDGMTFHVPMSVGHANARDIYIQSIALSDRLLDSEEKDTDRDTNDLDNPEWDFTDSYWESIFNSWDKVDGKNYRVNNFEGNDEKEYNKLILHGDGKFYGYPKEYLYFNGLNTGTSLKIKVYRNCKVKLSFVRVTDSGATIEIDGAEINSFSSNNDNVETTVKLQDGEESKIITIYFKGTKSQMYSVKLTD